MALHKRLDYGFNGYQVPPTPRAARSARKRCLFKRKADDQQMCAFDLLATVAGKLLSDEESSPPSANTSSGKEQSPVAVDSIGKDEKDEDKPLEEKSRDRDCCERNFLFTELVSEAPTNLNSCSNEIACTQNDVISGPASGLTTSDCSEKVVGPAEQLVNDDCKLRLGIFSPVDFESSGFKPSAKCGLEDEIRKDIKVEPANIRNLLISNNKASQLSSGHLETSDRKPSALVCSVNNNVKFPFSKDHTPCGSFPVSRDTVKLVTRDNDEKSSECTEHFARNKAIKPPPRIGDRRFRNFLPSKHCKITSNVKDEERYNAENFNYLNRKNNFKRQRSLRDYPFKKRKLYDFSLVSNSDEGISGNRICGAPENGTNGGGLGSGPTQPGVLGTMGYRIIDGFNIAQQTVMDAVNSVLGGGLCVGVLVQGKKIRDDNKTLLQTGILHDNKMDTLGFTLSPARLQPRYDIILKIVQLNFCVTPIVARLIRSSLSFFSQDKWKTLVHTARISPQQRRGEPVPQELLDRVLTAHAYWSQQQAKQQLKSQPDTCLLL
ncbi:hypothetical protein DH2020_000047 [Rehmannia glutinosa]|uniref:Telomere repeat-binding protein 1-6-like ubiquitin-like domain-containing protein n=1 Tax=Rehmannia glutinosa TaxID=99300 RepID=A0ABR0XVU6_REHGL